MDIDIVYSIASVYAAAEVILGGVLFSVGLAMGFKVAIWILIAIVEQFNEFVEGVYRWFTW